MPHFFRPLLPLALLLASVLPAQVPQTFLLQNGFPLARGEAFYHNGDLLLNHFNVGFTRNFSAGLGIVPTFFWDGGYIPYSFSMKWAVKVPERNISAALCFFHFGEYEYGYGSREFYDYVTCPYGVVTLGSRRKNFTVAGGGWVGEDYSTFVSGPFGGRSSATRQRHNLYPFFGFSAHLQGRGRVAFVTENFRFSDETDDHYIFLNNGMRLTGKRIALDIALLLIVNEYGPGDFEAYPVPWLGIMLPIGRRTRQLWAENRAAKP